MAKRKSPYSSTRYKKVKSNIEDVISKKTSSTLNNSIKTSSNSPYSSSRYKTIKNNIEDAMKKDEETERDIGKLIENYEKRLEGIDVNTEEAKDTRNAVEKFFNVQQDQNVLFDIFEVLGRPQQALFGGIESVQQGGDFWEGAKENWKGDDYTYGGDLLRNLGVSDKHLFTNPLNKESVSAADLGGLVLDIFADPIDIPIIGEIADIGKAVDVARTANKVADIAKVADTASDVAKTRLAFRPLARDSKSLLELGVGAGAKAGKKVVGATDNLITKGLTKIDNANLDKDIKSIGNISKRLGIIDESTEVTESMLPDLIKRLDNLGINIELKSTNLSDFYKGTKKGLSRTVDYAKSIPDNLYKSINQFDNAVDVADVYSKNLIGDLMTKAGKYANKTKRTAEEVADDVALLISSKYAPEISIADSVTDVMKTGKTFINGNADEIKNIAKMVEDVKISDGITNDVLAMEITNKGTRLKLTGNKKLLQNVYNNSDIMNKLSNIKISKSLNLDAKVKKNLKRVKNLYKKDSRFRKLVDASEPSLNLINNIYKQASGGKIDFSDMIREGFMTGNLTPEALALFSKLDAEGVGTNRRISNLLNKNIASGSTKEFGAKSYSNVAQQANIDIAKDLKDIAKRKETKLKNKALKYGDEVTKSVTNKKHNLEKLKDSLHSSRIGELKKQIDKFDIDILNNKANFESNMKLANIETDKLQEIYKNIKNSDIKVSDIVTDDILKKASKVNNPKLVKDLMLKTQTYTNRLSKVKSIQANLSKSGLTIKQVKSLEKQLEKSLNMLDTAKINLIIETEKMSGAIEESFIKNADKLVKKMEKESTTATKKAIKASEKAQNDLNNNLNIIRNLRESYDTVERQLITQQNNAILELKKLKSMSLDDIKKFNEEEFSKISRLQKEIELIHSSEGMKFFNTNYFQSIGDFVNKTGPTAKKLNAYNEIALQSGLDNENVIKFIPKGESVKKIPGYVKLDNPTMLTDYLNKMKNFLPEDSYLIKDLEKMFSKSRAVFIDESVAELAGILNKDIKMKPIVDMLNKFNNFFKRNSTLTPGFHLRNISGNTTNMILSGVPAHKIPGLYTKADKLVKSDYIMNLYEKSAKGSLTAAETADFKIIKKFLEGGFSETGKEVYDLGEAFIKATTDNGSKKSFKKALDKIFELNVKGNEWVDARNRMALLSYADKNPGYIRKLGAKDSIDAVKQVLFDPKNLSPFEQKYMKKIIPFYTFTKQNLVFQANNLIANTSKYKRLFKTFNETYDTVGEENYRQYQKENFEIPLFMGDEGLTTIKANLPVSDLGEYMSDPIGRLVSSTTPLIKTPFELASGVDTFTGQDISDRSGLETLARSLGLTNFLNSGKNIYNLASGETEVTPATISPSIFRYTDAEKLANQREYEELIQYQQIVKDLKNQGIDVPTINELANSTNATIKAVKKRRNEIQKRRS